jgi:hypothetical protein
VWSVVRCVLIRHCGFCAQSCVSDVFDLPVWWEFVCAFVSGAHPSSAVGEVCAHVCVPSDRGCVLGYHCGDVTHNIRMGPYLTCM